MVIKIAISPARTARRPIETGAGETLAFSARVAATRGRTVGGTCGLPTIGLGCVLQDPRRVEETHRAAAFERCSGSGSSSSSRRWPCRHQTRRGEWRSASTWRVNSARTESCAKRLPSQECYIALSFTAIYQPPSNDLTVLSCCSRERCTQACSRAATALGMAPQPP